MTEFIVMIYRECGLSVNIETHTFDKFIKDIGLQF